MKKLYLLILLTLSIGSIKAQTFIKKSNGLRINSFYHQQNIQYFLHTEDDNGTIYTVLYDTVSSGFNYGKEFSQIRLRIFNGISWLTTQPVKVYSKHTIDAPRILDILYFKGSIYISGSFDSSENNLGAGVLQYSSNNWSRVSDNLLQTYPDYFEVNKLYAYQNGIIATGNFDSIPGQMINGIAIYNGSNWSSIGTLGKVGFQNLSNTSNVFFYSVNDSLYVFNKNKIKPDSIEIGESNIKKIGVLRNGKIEQLPQPNGNINALGTYNKELTAVLTGNLIYIKTLAIYKNGNWQYHQLPNNDSFYSTNYLGQFEFGNKLYWMFQSPQARVIMYEFDGSQFTFYSDFKLSDNYLNLEYRTNLSSIYLSGNFNEIRKDGYRDSVNKIVEISLTPSSKFVGRCFQDLNSDGVYQQGEPLISKARIYNDKNEVYALSNGNGYYAFNATIGSSIRLNASNLLGLTTSSEILIGNSQDSIYETDLALKSNSTNDIALNLYCGTANKAKQGFVTRYEAEIVNTSDLDQTVTLTIVHNSSISNRQFINFNPTIKTGNQFSHIVLIKAHSRQMFNFTMVYGVGQFTIGEKVEVLGSLNILDINNKNNKDTLHQTVVAAFDPNIKVAYPSEIVETNDEIKYYIYFENLGNDTALNVTVVDTFQSLLSIKDAAYLSTYPFYVEPTIGQSTLTWHFENIHLPARKTDSLHSWGFVSFRVKLNKNAKKGDTIYNKAAIFFDYQKPVITNNAKVTFKKNNSIQSETSKQVLLYPNPSKGYFNVEMKTSGVIEIYNNIGQLVFETFIDQKGVVILPETLSNGLYILKLKGESDELGHIIINR